MPAPSQTSIFPATSASASRLIELLQQQHPHIRLRLAARSPHKLTPHSGSISISPTPLDTTNASSIRDALDGSDAAYILNPPFHTEHDPRGMSRTFGTNLVHAANDTPTLTKIVFLSSIGADKPSGTGLIGNTSVIETLFLQELRGGIDKVVLRPPYFLANFKMALSSAIHPPHVFVSELPFDEPNSFIDADTIAKAALKYLLSPPKEGEMTAVQLVTPSKTIPEITQMVSEIAGVNVTPVPDPEDKWADNFNKAGLHDQVAALIIEMRKAILSGYVSFLDQDSVEEEKKRGISVVTENLSFDIKPRLAEYIKEIKAGQSAAH